MTHLVSADQMLGHQIKLTDGRRGASEQWLLRGMREENGGTCCQMNVERLQK